MILVITTSKGRLAFEYLHQEPDDANLLEFKIVHQWSYDFFNKNVMRNYVGIEPLTVVVDLLAFEVSPSQLELQTSIILNPKMQIIVVGQGDIQETEKIKVIENMVDQVSLAKLESIIQAKRVQPVASELVNPPTSVEEASSEEGKQYFLKRDNVVLGIVGLDGGASAVEAILGCLKAELYASAMYSDEIIRDGNYHFCLIPIKSRDDCALCDEIFVLCSEEHCNRQQANQVTKDYGKPVHTFFSITEGGQGLNNSNVLGALKNYLYEAIVVA